MLPSTIISPLISIFLAALVSFVLNLFLNTIFAKKKNKQKELDYFIQKLEELDCFCFDYWYKGNTKNKMQVASKIKSRILLFHTLLINFKKNYKLKKKDYEKVYSQIKTLQKIATGRNFEEKSHKRSEPTYYDITRIINTLHRLTYIW